MRPWFERDEARLQRELAALTTEGVVWEIDEDARAQGILELQLIVAAKGGPVRLIATFPDLYPFFKPEVRAPELRLNRHQDPIGGNLCLVGRATSRWYAEETLAQVIAQQLPHLTEYAASDDLAPLHLVEEPQGEPASEYYASASLANSCILIDSGWRIPAAAARGTFTMRCIRTDRSSQGAMVLRGYVAQVRDEKGSILANWAGPALAGYDDELNGRWVRRDQPILGNHDRFEAELGDDARWLSGSDRWPPKPHTAVGAVIFPEEVRHREFADGWVVFQWTAFKLHRHRERVIGRSFVRVARAGVEDLAARTPTAAALATKSVVVFGVGAIGAPTAIELARAGVGRLTLVDHDVMEPATARRWPFGVTAFGRRKVEVLQEWLSSNYPWTDVIVYDMKLGAPDEGGQQPRQSERLADMLTGADLVLDATAELGVSHYLSTWTREADVRYVLANATPGAWGGMVARFDRDTPCWMCLRDALYGAQRIALPPADPHGEVQPPGCAEPTFTGSGFDAQEVSLEAVRTVVGMLVPSDGYAGREGTLATLRMRDEVTGTRVPPQWTMQVIPSGAGCTCAVRS